jgi:hypothetical protein
MRMGQVIGATTRNGERPRERPLDPHNILATAYHHLGIDHTYQHTLIRPAGRMRWHAARWCGSCIDRGPAGPELGDHDRWRHLGFLRRLTLTFAVATPRNNLNNPQPLIVEAFVQVNWRFPNVPGPGVFSK